MYYKHQKGNNTVSVIAGVSAGKHSFIQLISNKNSYYFEFPPIDFNPAKPFRIGDNLFSAEGIAIHIDENGVLISGELKYTDLTPLLYDIMGPFKHLPMQCKHRVFSLHHRLEGSLSISGDVYGFNGGVGYMEGDFGSSFPDNYLWIQCSDFPGKSCVMASVADIPFAGLRFRGCVCVVYIDGVEYRLATYLGVKILSCTQRHVFLKQGKLSLEIELEEGTGYKLIAPEKGEMVREIHERVVCGARFRFKNDGKILFEHSADNASFEYVSK